MIRSRSSVLLVTTLLVVLAALPAAGFGQAQHSPFGWYVEAGAGSWSPGPSLVSADSSFVLRLGWKSPQTRWGMDFQYGIDDGKITGLELEGLPLEVDLELKPFDLSLGYFPIMNRRFQLMILFGPGWSWSSAKAKVPVDDENNINAIKRFSDDSFTVNIGLAARIFFTDKVYVRLDGRGRWYENREGDEIDSQYTAGIGINF